MENLGKLARLIRYFILVSTTEAGSGHPTSALSATDLMTTLFFDGFFKADLDKPENPNNDRLIFSKGHASPLFYSLYGASGKVSEEELKTLRKFGSKLEGHPTLEFPFTEVGTGSLGQGLSIGVGMALNAKLDKLSYKTYVLLGDSEMAEGSIWEAIQSAAHYKLDNLIGILDVNRLGQRGETMYGHDIKAYQKRVSSFGWETYLVDGHNLEEIRKILKRVQDDESGNPKMIIAKTLKGKGVSFLENKDGWHGKALKPEELEKALEELGEVDKKLRGMIKKPENEENVILATTQSEAWRRSPESRKGNDKSQTLLDAGQASMTYKKGDLIATRKAYGNALVRVGLQNKGVVVLDAEVSNSTYSEFVKKEFPERFFEMYIAEQNMVGVALGFSRRGKIPFISTFAAFFTRAFDQIRMSQYSDGNIKFCGSHAGVSIGDDGASQMGLEDLSLFRTLLESVVLYPSDATSAEKLVDQALEHYGNVYIRTTRMETPVIYKSNEEFRIGGSKIHRIKGKGARVKGKGVTIVGAGVTLHEAIKAQQELLKENIEAVVLDLYSIKPIDTKTLTKLSKETDAIITVEDHYEAGGLGEAVKDALSDTGAKIYSLAVRKMPHSGKPEELLSYEGIDAKGIVKKVREVLNGEAK